MLVLKQLVIIASGCVAGILAVGFFLAASAPAATRSLDYLLAAMVFLLGFAAGTAAAGWLAARVSAFQPTTKPTVENAGGLDLGPLADEPTAMPRETEDLLQPR